MSITELKLLLARLVIETDDRKILEEMYNLIRELMKSEPGQSKETITYPSVLALTNEVKEEESGSYDKKLVISQTIVSGPIDENWDIDDIVNQTYPPKFPESGNLSASQSADRQIAEKTLEKTQKLLENLRIKNREKIVALTQLYADLPKVDMSNFKFNRQEANER